MADLMKDEGLDLGGLLRIFLSINFSPESSFLQESDNTVATSFLVILN